MLGTNRNSKYGLAEMKDAEALLYIDTVVAGGADVKEAIKDMRCVDALLSCKRLYIAVKPNVTKTKAGHLRRNSTLYDLYDAIIEGRLNDTE